MTLPEYVREIAFWGLDLVNGSPIGKHVKDLEQAFADPEKGRDLAAKRLELFLEHACSTTEFYKSFASKRLDEFPVIQKKTIKENYEAFLSSKFQKEELAKTTTSGSYGMPFTFYLTKEKRARQQAEVLVFSRFAGYRVGMKFAHILGRVNSCVILSLIYYLALVPTGGIRRLFGRSSDKFRFKNTKASYWIRREDASWAETMKRPY